MLNINGAEQMLILANMTSLNAASFRERVEVAAAAGFDALGISLPAFRDISSSEMSAKEMKAVLDANGVQVAELEAVFGMAVDPAATGVPFGGGLVYTTAEDLKDFWGMAELFGARHLQAVGAFDTDELEPDAVERFAALCDQAAEVGLKVALEFVPTTNIPDAGVATRIVREAGRSNSGLCVDSWHHTRGANDLDLIRAIPSEHVVMIQLDDGPAKPVDPNFLNETLHYRQIPGDGEFDLDGFLGALYQNGTSAPVSLEVISDALAQLDAQDGAHRLVKGTSTVVEGVAQQGSS
jgi:sugar phosphate isomerase/epimerase